MHVTAAVAIGAAVIASRGTGHQERGQVPGGNVHCVHRPSIYFECHRLPPTQWETINVRETFHRGALRTKGPLGAGVAARPRDIGTRPVFFPSLVEALFPPKRNGNGRSRSRSF